MIHPRIIITANGQKDGEYTKHDTSVSWTVAFIRFAEPASAYAGKSKKTLDQIKKTLIVENDCISVNINNSKSSFAKTCSLQMKVTDNWYIANVNPGDWVFVWLNDSQDENNEIQKLLGSNNFKNQKALNGYHSGLKFVGRVLSLGAVDNISSGGTRTLAQTVNCQSFLELATSIYTSYTSASITNPDLATPSGGDGAANQEKIARAILIDQSLNKNANVLTDFAGKFLSLYSNDKSSFSPDSIIGYLFALTMGVSREQNPSNAFLKAGIDGTFNDAITIPKTVDSLLGNRGATRLCQIYQVILGLQQYKNTGNATPALKLTPDLVDEKDADDVNGSTNKKKANSVIYQTPVRCKGFVPFYPPPWDNQPIWGIMAPYLNPVVNEMYTALRINKNGVIMPTVVVREIPFSTGLYKALNRPKLDPGGFDLVKKKTGRSFTNFPASSNTTSTEAPTGSEFEKIADDEQSSSVYDQQSTYFGNLPRWAIDESMILSVNTITSESKRVNFVQVWGRSAAADWAGASQQSSETLKQSQMIAGNYRADVADIQRHGLRADIKESPFDTLDKGMSYAPEWARRRADWLFNGHLKLEGTITCVGIQEPICEGDNVEVRGIVYHIEGVTHTASLSSNGMKSFVTTLQVSNGLVAKSLTKDTPPSYMCHLPKSRKGHVSSGFSEVQTRDSSNTRDGSGEGDGEEE